MRTALAAAALLALVPFTLPAVAGPDEYVRTPVVIQGEREIDTKFGFAKARDGSSESGLSVGLGYGATDGWFTEFYAKWHREPKEKSAFDAWEWENRFQLTETGRHPFEVGVLLEVERPKDRDEGYEFRYGPLLQTEFGSVQANLNLLFERHVRAADPSATEFGYQWQLRWNVHPQADWGLQGFGDVGKWNDWSPRSEQSHRLGPAVFGKLKTGPHQAVEYNAALLFGTGGAAPKHTLRVQAEFEF